MSNMTNFMRVKQFHELFGYDFSKMTTSEKASSRYNLIEEEFMEVEEHLINIRHGMPVNRKALAKELADLLYMVYGTAEAFDIPIDLVFRHVHASNLSKLDENGKAILNESGKIQTGPNYVSPDLSFLDE